MQTVRKADGIRIAFDRSGHGPALILVAPASASRISLAGLAAALAPDFSVFAYNRRGPGDGRDIPPYPAEREVENLDTLIDKASGAEVVFSGGSDAGHGRHAVPGFSGIPVAGHATALEWYRRLLRFPPTFCLNDLEARGSLRSIGTCTLCNGCSMPGTPVT